MASLLRASFLAIAMTATALPVAAQQVVLDLPTLIRDKVEQEYVLARCAGYFKSLTLQNADADAEVMARAKATIEWFYNSIVTLKTGSNEGDMGALGLEVAGDINAHADFYLKHMLANIAATGTPNDDLIAKDQRICFIIARQGAPE